MDLKTQKRIAGDILKAGRGRIKVTEDKEVEEALTREDIRRLIKKGLITKRQKKGVSVKSSKMKRLQKKKGRRKSVGSKKGKIGTRYRGKENWMKQARSLRRLLKELREKRQIENQYYQKLYLMVKGNMFRNRKHLLYYLKDKGMLKKAETGKKKSAGGKTKQKGG
jgi:large subunit ribosomal protein L19e